MPGEGLAVAAGKFIGAVIGEALKIAGPQIEELLANAIRRAFQDKAVDSNPGAVDQSAADDLMRKYGSAGAAGPTGATQEGNEKRSSMGFGRQERENSSNG